MATGRVVFQYREDAMLVFHIALDNDIQRVIGGSLQPVSMEYRIDIPFDEAATLTSVQLRQEIIRRLRIIRQRYRRSVETEGLPAFPVTVTVPDD